MNQNLQEFQESIKGMQILDSKRKYILFDLLWSEPKLLNFCAEHILQYILDELSDKIPENKSNLVILSPINAKSDLGVLPISTLIANMLGCRIAVWRELADIKWGTSAILGPEVPGLQCLVLQHVIRHGTTLVRVAQNIQETNLKWNLFAFVAVISNPVDGVQNIKESIKAAEAILEQKIEFHGILSAHEL